MWRLGTHQPLEPAAGARHLDNQAQAPGGHLDNAHGRRIAPVVNDSVASMSPSSPNSATIANSSKNKRKRPSTALRGIAHPTKRTARRKSARKKSKKQKEVFWPIKDVLEEEIDEEGTSRYLVEWEGLDEDGKPFKPDWVQDITDDALQAWQAKQRANSNWSNNSQANSNPSQSSCASQQARAGPELLAGAQGKEPVPRGAFDSPESRPRKRRRTVVLDSQETGELSSNNHCEVRAREAGDDLNHSLKKIIVEITRKSSFDPSEYLDVQLSQQSQQEGVLEVTQDSILQTSAVRQLQGHHESNRTIPDSQEPSAFSISEIGLSASQLNLEIFTERSLSQISNSRRQSPSAQSVSGTGAEIPSHQPDLRISGQITIPNSGVPSRSAQLAHCSESVPESPSAHLATLEKSPFQTQELFISRPVSPASSLEPAQTAVNQSQAEPDVFLQPSHTLSIYSSQTSSIRQSQSVSGALSETSSQAAQIVPHSLSHSEGIHSPLPRDFSVYNDNNNDNETVPESSRPRIDQRTSQSSSQVLSQLDGNIRIHLSAHISHGRGAQPEIPHLLPQTFTDKSSDNAVANEVLTGYDPQSSPAPHKSVQSSDHSVTRHSQRPITPNNKMEGVTSTNESEKPVSLKEKLRLIRERRFGSTPDKASDPEATEQSKEDAGANVQNTDPIRATVQDMDDLNHATQHSDELGLLHMPHHEPREFSDPPTISPALLVPSVEMTHRDDAAPMFGDSLGHAGSIEEPMFDQTTVMTTTYEPHPEEQPATLDPSALTLSIEDDIMEADDNDESPSIPTDDDQPPTGGQDSTDGLLPLHAVIPEAPEPNILPYIDPGLNEFIVTLPLASNIRPQYVEIIKECNNDLIAYNAALTTPPYLAPVPALIAKVDDMFNRLLDICDIPLDLDTLQRVSPAKVAKFVRATNSKYAFVGQFLEQVSKNTTVHRSILLVARPGPIVDLLNSLLQAYGYQSHTAGTTTTAKSWSSDHVFVTVYPSSGQPFALQNDYDVVLAFDHTYRQDLLPTVLRENPPITLILVTTTSLQHLNMRISEKIEPVIRKNYLMLALCASIDDIITPDSGYPQTHEIAALFANFVIAPDDDDFYWTAQEPAESIFERVAASSQATDVQSSLLPDVVEGQRLSKKRSLDIGDEVDAKRPKIAQPEIATSNRASLAFRSHIPDPLKKFIGVDVADPEDDSVVRMSVTKAEALAAKMVELEAELEKTRTQRDQFRDLADRTKLEVDSWTTSMSRIQPRYMAALRDRGISQKERIVALEKQKATTKVLQAAQEELLSTSQANIALQQKLSEARKSLLDGGNPELARIVRMEQELEAARIKISDLEKKVDFAQKDRDYVSGAYQTASQSALDLRKENDELQQKIVDLTRRAADNIVKINQTQQRSEVNELVRLLEEQRTIVRDRENELNRAREQLASIKNGRRETRQSSVPRSPRLNVSSPRNPVRRAATEAASGSASRGASPSALGTFEVGANLMPGIGSLFAGQQQGNGRYAHLRD